MLRNVPFAFRSPEGPDADLLIYGMMHHSRCDEISYRQFWEYTGTEELRRVFPKYSWDDSVGARLCDDLRVRYFRSFLDDSACYFVRRSRRVWAFPFRPAETFEEKLAWIDHRIELYLLEIQEGKGPTVAEYAAMFDDYDGPWATPPGHKLAWERKARRSLLERYGN